MAVWLRSPDEGCVNRLCGRPHLNMGEEIVGFCMKVQM
nr:MAG TPA: hypothetical protein [Caudoviricetes sp.]